MSDAIKEVEKMRDDWRKDGINAYAEAAIGILNRLKSLGTQRPDRDRRKV